jgi:TolB-like protein/tetratricopeptide (TPR) repeat protein
MSLVTELRRRNVFRVAIAYAVVAWLVAQVAELALDSFGSPDWVMKTLLLFLALGLPFAIIFAWAFELTPEGVKREKDVDRSQSITNQTGQKLNTVIIGSLIIALVVAVGMHFRGDSPDPVDSVSEVVATSGNQSIAVLPFVNMSDDPDNEYFSDGISEELLNVLVKVEGLRVASRTSSFSFKGKDTPIPAIADALKVEHVLEGSVRKAGDTIRITAQLIDVRTDSHLWSETYDRKFEDIFVIQDEISAHIVEALKVALGAGENVETVSKPTDNLAAYEDYLKGRYLWQRRGEDNIRTAIELFKQATEADPVFARAWSSLAAAHITLPAYANVENKHHYQLALDHATRALRLDPMIAEAHAVLGDVARVSGATDLSQVAQHYIRAIELEPKVSTGYLWYTEFLLAAGRTTAALDNINIALQLDPFHPGTMAIAGAVHQVLGNYEKAEEYTQTAIDLGHPFAVYDMLELSIVRGNYATAKELARDLMDEEDIALFDMYIAAQTDASLRDQFLEQIREVGPPNLLFEARDLALFGYLDKAFENLERARLLGNDSFFLWDLKMRPLRQDPRFVELIRKNGFIDYWDKAGWPPLCKRDGQTVTCS